MPEKKTPNVQIGHRISAYILLIGILSILATSAISFYLEYKRDIKEIHDKISELSHTAVENLSRSTWEANRGQIQADLENLNEVAGVRFVALHSPELGDFSAGVSSPENSAFTYPLSVRLNDQEIQLGSLDIQTSRKDAIDKARHHLTAIVSTQAASILLITLLLSYMIRRMLVRHLASMSDYVNKLEIMNTDTLLYLDRPKRDTRDELDEVVASINSMRIHLHTSYFELQEANDQQKRDIAKRKEIEHELIGVKKALEGVFDNIIPLCITNKDFEVIQANHSYNLFFKYSEKKWEKIHCYESRPGSRCKTDQCPLTLILKGSREVSCETTKTNIDGTERHYLMNARPFLNENSELVGIIESFHDITERKVAEQARERLLLELQEALAKVKLLSGFLPICASCKKIRDDKGYWNQIEEYIRDHSEAEFSHGICPDCIKRLYPEFHDNINSSP